MTGAARIVGGMFGSGQVEIFLSGRWGSICAGGHWDTNAAQVVCRELGFTDGTATATVPENTTNPTVYQVSPYYLCVYDKHHCQCTLLQNSQKPQKLKKKLST